MARYGRDYQRGYDRWGGGESGQGFGGDYGNQPGRGSGGMRSDGWGSEWSRFPGEDGWYGQAHGGEFRGPPGGTGYGASGFGGSGYGTSGYGGRYGGRDAGYGGRESGSGGWQQGGRAQSRASEIMTENPDVVTPDASLSDVAKKMKELNVGLIPVVDNMDNRRLRGVITDRDIAIRAIAEGKDGKASVSDCMTSRVESVNKNDSIDEVMHMMSREQIRRVPVTDREGRIVGIIAQADLAVDYGDGQHRAGHRVQETVEAISEPARPERSGGAMRAEGRENSDPNA